MRNESKVIPSKKDSFLEYWKVIYELIIRIKKLEKEVKERKERPFCHDGRPS